MGGTGLGGEMEGAIGGMFGSTIGDSGGFGGLGLKGTGSGGGGMGNTIGVGGLGTRGRGGGQYGYGTGVAKIRDRGERNVNISVGQPIIMGSLSMEIIRQVINSHRDQIKYCYEQALTRNPKLGGKVAIRFTISPKGYVTQATVSQTTMNNSSMEGCVTQKIRTWKFPEPKGGGIVIVNYPFIFNPPD
jgi:TonB family protein